MTHILNIDEILKHLSNAMTASDLDVRNSSWQKVTELFPYSTEMANCIQDSVYHAEGDVWTHNRMILESQFSKNDNSVTQILTTLFHDVAKAKTREEIITPERIRISHPHHSRIGAQMTWENLWANNIGTIAERLQIYYQIKWHQKAFHIWKSPDMLKTALQYDCNADWKSLINFALHDNIGRIAPNTQETVDSLELLAMWLDEHNAYKRNWTTESRIFYFEKENRSPDYVAQPTTGSKVVLMSGLPGSGKDTYVERTFHGIPVISLDAIRIKSGFKHGDNQGPIIQAGIEQAKEYLRKKTPFVWNSTNLTKLNRQKIIKLCRDYDAYVSVHVLCTEFKETLRRNKERKESIPESAIYNMLAKWEPASLTDSHEVHWIEN